MSLETRGRQILMLALLRVCVLRLPKILRNQRILTKNWVIQINQTQPSKESLEWLSKRQLPLINKLNLWQEATLRPLLRAISSCQMQDSPHNLRKQRVQNLKQVLMLLQCGLQTTKILEQPRLRFHLQWLPSRPITSKRLRNSVEHLLKKKLKLNLLFNSKKLKSPIYQQRYTRPNNQWEISLKLQDQNESLIRRSSLRPSINPSDPLHTTTLSCEISKNSVTTRQTWLKMVRAPLVTLELWKAHWPQVMMCDEWTLLTPTLKIL